MGTRSVIHVRETEYGAEFVSIYRHMDGYPRVGGRDLKEFLTGYRIVNGVPLSLSGCVACGVHRQWHEKRDHEFVQPKVANGPGDLASQLVTAYKRQHDVYLVPFNVEQWPSYHYFVWLDGDWLEYDHTKNPAKIMLKCVRRHDDKVLYSGPVDGFDPLCEAINV